MKNSTSNLKLEYLHRDESNYKIFGSAVFKNPNGIEPEQATAMLKERLIDTDFFYPEDASIPLFQEHARIGNYFSGWYEFDQFSISEEIPSDPRAIEEFIEGLKKQ